MVVKISQCFKYLRDIELIKNNTLIRKLLSLRPKRMSERRTGIPLTRLILPHLCACPKQVPAFSTSYVMVFLLFSEFSLEER